MTEVSLKELLEAGVHFGHQTKRWNPRMKPYIFGARDGIYIINLQKTLLHLIEAQKFVTQTVAEGGKVLFVGTKKQASDIVAEEAKRCGMLFVSTRWLGGTLTNFQTIKKSIERLREMEKMETEEKFSRLTKKEHSAFRHEKEKLVKYFGGMRDMKSPPQALFVIDTKKEYIPIKEARKKGIPVLAVVDTNCDPVGISHVIPGNDDGIRSIRLFVSRIADACLEGARLKEEKLRESAASPPVDQAAPPAGAESPPQAP